MVKMINIPKFAIFLLIIVDAIVIFYNFYLLMKVQSKIKKLPKNNLTGIGFEYLELIELIPINWAMTLINILFLVLR